MVDLREHTAGIEAAHNAYPTTCQDPRGEALSVLQSMGGSPQSIVMGNLQRIKGERCKSSEKDLWYVYHEIDDTFNEGHVIGRMSYGYHKDQSSFYWSSRSENTMSPLEREAYRKSAEEAKLQYERDKLERQAEAAKEAYKIWSSASDATSIHEYLTTKGVGACVGLKQAIEDGKLAIVPCKPCASMIIAARKASRIRPQYDLIDAIKAADTQKIMAELWEGEADD